MSKRVLDVGCGGGRYLYHSAVTQSLGEVFNLARAHIEIPRIKNLSREKYTVDTESYPRKQSNDG